MAAVAKTLTKSFSPSEVKSLKLQRVTYLLAYLSPALATHLRRHCGRLSYRRWQVVHHTRVAKMGPKKRSRLEKSTPDNKIEGSGALFNDMLNTDYNETKFKDELRESFDQRKPLLIDTKMQFYLEPFPCCCLPDFIRDDEFLQNLKDELLELNFSEKSNDLYKFHQSDELKTVSSTCISRLRKFLYTDIVEWLRNITGISLTDEVDMTCARYDYTDVLLCHDDELEGRRIAYILYLVPPWTLADGGTLDLFACDEHNTPTDVTRSIVPAWNNFVFFEVSPVSFHQVSEILTEDKTRLSISGWFHGPTLPRPPRPRETAPLLQSPSFVEESEFYDWINPTYLEADVQTDIRLRFEEESEIEIPKFLKDEKYQLVAEALLASGTQWVKQGPPDKKNYWSLKKDSVPEIVAQCLNVLQSEAMFLTLSNLTGLRLHPMYEDESNEREGDANGNKQVDSKCTTEIRRWTHGCYTLLDDDQWDKSEFALDALLFFSCGGQHNKVPKNDAGGYISYVAKSDEEELLWLSPGENCFALVYREKGTASFMKYINHRYMSNDSDTTKKQFHDMSIAYYEDVTIVH